MPDYVVLMTLQQKGKKDLFDASAFVAQMVDTWRQNCGPVAAFRMTMGEFDFVLFGEAATESAAAEYALYVSEQGRVKTVTMRAFRLEEMEDLVTEAARFGPRGVVEPPTS